MMASVTLTDTRRVLLARRIRLFIALTISYNVIAGMTLASDGTAYVINNDVGPTASVYALTPPGAQKVFEAAGRSNTSQSFVSEFEPNGTAYVTLGTATRDTLLYSFSALTVV